MWAKFCNTYSPNAEGGNNKYQNIKNEINSMAEKAKKYDRLIPYKQVELRCSLCDKPQHETKRLITSNNIYVCEECVALMNVICEENVKDYKQMVESLREHNKDKE